VREAEQAGAPPGPTARIQWGIPDAAIAWLAGLVVSLLASAPLVDVDKAGDQSVSFLLVALFTQSAGVIGWLAYVARRKGLGSLASDFGLRVAPATFAWVLAGAALAVVAGWLLLPIIDLADLDESGQDVVRIFEDAGGVDVPFFLVGVVVLAPVAEELLFRGALLRGLLRRTSPMWAVSISALAFALIHVLGDVGSGYYVPAFLLLGMVSGWMAVTRGSLAASIGLHAGFNLVGAIAILS
jgi:membrane protease YdiL (CAAX protease family)